MAAPAVKVSRHDGTVGLRCQRCNRLQELRTNGFTALVEGLNQFLAQHRSCRRPATR